MDAKVEPQTPLLKKSGCTLRQVARQAGVDVSTVSRALSGDPRISDERVQAIRQLAEEMGYRPQPLRTKRTHAIGYIISTLNTNRPDDEFQRRVAWQAQQTFGQLGYHVNVEHVFRDAVGVGALPELVRQNRVDGVLLAGHPSESLVECIRGLGMPTVAISDSARRIGIPCVSTHSYPVVRDAVWSLAGAGHERFAMLSSNLAFPTVNALWRGFSDALNLLGLAPAPEMCVTGLMAGVASGREGIRRLLAGKRLPTAVFCCNDWMALGVMLELQKRGLRIPEDVVLVGHDDLPFCEELEPPLTSIRHDDAGVVQAAAGKLDAMIRGEACPAEDTLVEERIIWRASTGTPETSRPEEN